MKRLVFSIIVITSTLFAQSQNTKPVIIGYVAGYNGLINQSTIDAAKLTHINYAFVNVKGNAAWLENESTDVENFRRLNELKKINPDLKLMISIGGWSWSKNFSTAVLTDSSRKEFAATSVAIVQKNNLDGVDIDWEYPNMRGDGNVFRPEDKQNYTLMFQAIRNELDKAEKVMKRKLLLTTAVGAFPGFIANTEMHKAEIYLDYVNLMTYDYSWGVAGHHTNLYHSSDYNKENSTHKAVTDFMAAGVPASKLVVGMAFYSRGGIVDSAVNNGLNRKIVGQAKGGGYGYIKDSVINKKGFTRYWDEKAQAPYLFNATTRQFLSYDDEQSVRLKCEYVKKYKLGGVMFWEYSSDPKGYLLSAAASSLSEQ